MAIMPPKPPARMGIPPMPGGRPENGRPAPITKPVIPGAKPPMPPTTKPVAPGAKQISGMRDTYNNSQRPSPTTKPVGPGGKTLNPSQNINVMKKYLSDNGGNR